LKQEHYINSYSIIGVVVCSIIGICINELGIDIWIAGKDHFFEVNGGVVEVKHNKVIVLAD